MTLKETNEQDTLSNLNGETSGGLSLKDVDTPSQTGASPNPWDVPQTTATSSGENNQTSHYDTFDEPYVSTSTSTAKQNITFKEFYKDYCSSVIKKNINGAAIALYICSGITLLVCIFATALGVSGIASALDAFLILGLTLGIHIGKSRACAVIVLIYSVINCIVSLIVTGRLGGILILIAAIYATIYTFKARKDYNNYING